MRKIKIAEVITRLDRGGAADIVLSIVKNLDLERFQVSLISGLTQYPTKELQEIKKKDVRLIFIPFLRRNINPILDFFALFKLYRLFQKGKYDIVHTHTAKAGALGRLSAWAAKVPIVIHSPHGHDFYGYFGPLRSKAIVLLERFLSRFSDKIVALTELDKQDHVGFGVAKEEKLEVIYSGVDLERFIRVEIDVNRKKEELGIPSGSPIVGMVARLEPIKGPIYFIEAARKILDRKKEVRFLVVGDGSLRRHLEKKARQLKIFYKVIFCGFRSDIPEILELMDVVVLPSLNEGMGRSLVEAQASGKPVVATKVGGIPEVVKDRETGFLVSPKDSSALAGAILNLLEDRALAKRMGGLAREWARSKFDLKLTIGKFLSLYENLIKSSGIDK